MNQSIKYKEVKYYLVAVLVILTAIRINAFGVKYGNEFLKFGTGVRENSLGGATITNTDPVVAAYWNPALISSVVQPEIQIMHTEEFAGVVNNDHVFLSLPGRKDFNYSAGFFRTGVDHIPATENTLIEYGTENGQLDAGDRIDYNRISYFNASESAFFLAGSKTLNSNLALGATWKTIYKNFFENYAWGFGLDAGIFYQPVDNLNTGAVIRDLTTTFLFWNDGEKEVIKPSLAFGTSYNYYLGFINLELVPMLELAINFDGEQNQRDINIQNVNVRFKSGLEMVYNELLALRAGRDELGSIHIGCGIKTYYGNLDYGFAMGNAYNELGNSHQVALTLNVDAVKNLIKTR
jgi:hypothetical protein